MHASAAAPVGARVPPAAEFAVLRSRHAHGTDDLMASSSSSAALASLLQASAAGGGSSAGGGVGGGGGGGGAGGGPPVSGAGAGTWLPLARNGSSSALLVDLPVHLKGGGTLSRSNSFSLFRGGLLSGGGSGAGGASTLLGSPGGVGFGVGGGGGTGGVGPSASAAPGGAGGSGGGVPRSPSILSLLSGNPTVALRESHSTERLLGLVPKAPLLGRQGSYGNLAAGGGVAPAVSAAGGGGGGGIPPPHQQFQHGGLLTGGGASGHPPALIAGNGGSNNHLVAHFGAASTSSPLGVLNLSHGGLGERALSFSQLPGLGVELDLDESGAVAAALQDGKWCP